MSLLFFVLGMCMLHRHKYTSPGACILLDVFLFCGNTFFCLVGECFFFVLVLMFCFGTGVCMPLVCIWVFCFCADAGAVLVTVFFSLC